MSTDAAAAARIRRRQVMKGVTEKLRNEVCSGPEYPGNPEDYTYVLSESCRPKRSTRRATQQQQQRQQPATNTDPFGREVNKKELERVNSALRLEYPRRYKDSNLQPELMPHVLYFFENMVMAENRKKHPDPIERYSAIMTHFQNSALARRPASRSFDCVPRYTILRLVAAHLRALLDK